MRAKVLFSIGLLLLVGVVPALAQGLLRPAVTFSTIPNYPEGLGFSTAQSLIYIIDTDFPLVHTYTRGGAYVNTVATVPPIDDGEGIDVLPNGNLLISNGHSAGGIGPGIYEYDTSGNQVGAGINISLPADDPNGAVLHTGTNSIWVADESSDQIREYATTGGAPLTVYDIANIHPSFTGCDGIDFDPATGNLFVGDDHGYLWEITTAGALVDYWETEPFAGSGVTDLEGVAYDETTGTIWVSFDSDYLVIGLDRSLNVPTLGGWGIMLLSALIAGAGVLVARRFIA